MDTLSADGDNRNLEVETDLIEAEEHSLPYFCSYRGPASAQCGLLAFLSISP